MATVTIVNIYGISNVIICPGVYNNTTTPSIFTPNIGSCIAIPSQRTTVTLTLINANAFVAYLKSGTTSIQSNVISNPLNGQCFIIVSTNNTISLEQSSICTIPSSSSSVAQSCANNKCSLLYSKYSYISNVRCNKCGHTHHKKHSSSGYHSPKKCNCVGQCTCGLLYSRYNYIRNTRRR